MTEEIGRQETGDHPKDRVKLGKGFVARLHTHPPCNESGPDAMHCNPTQLYEDSD